MSWLTFAAEAWTKQWLIELVADYGYVGVIVFLVLCGLGMPVPEEVALIGGGYAVFKTGGGVPEVTLMCVAAMFGILLGDGVLWAIGRKFGDHAEKVPIIGRHLSPQRMKKARALFAKYGPKAAFFGRYLFGVRAVTFFVCGSMRVPLPTFLLMDGLAGLVNVPASVVLAWYFGAELEQALAWLSQLNTIVIAVVVGALAILGYSFWRRSREALADDAPLPPEVAAAAAAAAANSAPAADGSASAPVSPSSEGGFAAGAPHGTSRSEVPHSPRERA